MADGILDGISNAVSGAGDFFLNRGRYADPNAINAQFGVPEQDVRQAGINTLANVSALLLAAGQPMTGSERAKLLAGIGPAMGGMQTDIFKSSQARLMNAQQRDKLTEMQELQALDAERKKDPEGLAKKFELPVGAINAFSIRDLRDIAKQKTIKTLTKSPVEQFVERETAAALGGMAGQPVQPGAAAAVPATTVPTGGATAPAAVGVQTEAAPAPALTAPEGQRQAYVQQLRQLAARIAPADPERAKKLLENADLIESPSLKQARTEIGKQEGISAAAAPTSVGFADETLRLIGELKSNEEGLNYVTGNVYGRANMPYSFVPTETGDKARNARSLIEQLQGRSFLEAYRTALKGAGPVTEKEGAKGEAAIARLAQTYVNTEDYQKALSDFEDVVKKLRAGALEVGQKFGTIPKQAQPAAPASGQLRVDPAAIADAKRAISSGAPAAAVRQRLRERGLSDEGL